MIFTKRSLISESKYIEDYLDGLPQTDAAEMDKEFYRQVSSGVWKELEALLNDIKTVDIRDLNSWMFSDEAMTAKQMKFVASHRDRLSLSSVRTNLNAKYKDIDRAIYNTIKKRKLNSRQGMADLAMDLFLDSIPKL